MSTAARIDELRKKFEENPRRYFAPLANEYRKSGDLEQAIALCREHLPKQPGHMSGYIVFGQALYEAGEMGESRAVFEQALALDPENLIALRHLGDIARASGDALGARRWYERVLDADPRNDDIAAQLATLATGQTPVSVPSITAPVPTFQRSMDTPPIPMTPIGFGAMPTPDSVMRAVDMDAINERVVRSTPIPLSAFSTPASVPAQAEHTHDADDTPPMRPVDAEPIDVSDWGAVDTDASTDAIVADAQALADPFEFPHPDHASDVDEPDAQADAERAAADAAFEEGLVAPEWPEAADIVARFATPRSVTPRSVTPHSLTPHSLTPMSSGAVGDAIEAFGREAQDAVVPTPLTEEHENIQAMARSTPLAQPVVESATIDEPAFDPPALFVPTNAVASSDAIHADDPFVSTHETVEQEAMQTSDHASMDVEGVAETVEVEEAMDVVSAMSFADEVSEPDTDQVIEAEREPIAEHVDASSPTVSFEHDREAPEELPWLQIGDSVSQHEVQDNPEPGLQEIAEAFAEDARAAGDAESLIVEALDEPSSTATHSESLSADEGRSADDEAFGLVTSEFESYADVASDMAATSPSTGFVTETMAELLVSQGFFARAIDVYEELARRNPSDALLASRLADVRAMMATPSAESVVESTPVEADYRETDHEDVFDAWGAVDHTAPTPAYGTPAFGTPAVGSSALDTPPFPTPALGTPAMGTPAFPTPAMGTPAFPTPAFPTPALGTPAFGSPSMGAAASETPAYTASQPTPTMNTPIMPVAAITDATWGTPARITPYAQPAVGDEPMVAGRTAREWFAALAARRVPRRTPSQSFASIETPAEGLASLFGTDPTSQDDEAARALADAFAPVTSADLAAGSALDFEFARSTPAFMPVVAATPTPAPGVIAQTSAPMQPEEHAGGGGNAGFSFDKFFPDPATRRETPSAGASETPSAPVTDDLAQFSAWLKGLGNS